VENIRDKNNRLNCVIVKIAFGIKTGTSSVILDEFLFLMDENSVILCTDLLVI